MSTANEPAFPIPSRNRLGQLMTESEAIRSVVGGLSKRELFAAMAMQGLCANMHAWEEKTDNETASLALKRADALLAELEKNK